MVFGSICLKLSQNGASISSLNCYLLVFYIYYFLFLRVEGGGEALGGL